MLSITWLLTCIDTCCKQEELGQVVCTLALANAISVRKEGVKGNIWEVWSRRSDRRCAGLAYCGEGGGEKPMVLIELVRREESQIPGPPDRGGTKPRRAISDARLPQRDNSTHPRS